MRRIVLATEDRFPHGIDDDRLALPELEARGIGATFASWEDPGVDWAAFDAVVIRSTWNYTLRRPAYLRWLEALPVPVYNSQAILRWNSDKRYLFQLAGRGVPVIETRPLSPDADLGRALREAGWSEVVVKPVVGAGARNTWRLRADNAEEVSTAIRAVGEDMLIQPFVPEITTRGEWSLLYFGGAFSHALLKRPASGDFRVQEDFGGQVIPAGPPDALRALGAQVLDAVGTDLLYARIDLVEAARGPMLVEAELVEPELFLRAHPLAPARFAEAVATCLA